VGDAVYAVSESDVVGTRWRERVWWRGRRVLGGRIFGGRREYGRWRGVGIVVKTKRF
jgi:hypothetical protein